MMNHTTTFNRAAVLALILTACLGGFVQALAADSVEDLYRKASRAMDRNSYTRAAELYEDVYREYAGSALAADAPYYRAFALYRLGGAKQLQAALGALELQASNYPRAGTLDDAASLRLRIRGALAKLGDAGSAEEVLRSADGVHARHAEREALAEARELERDLREMQRDERDIARAVRGMARGRDTGELSEEEELRLMALNALLQMESDRVLPILRKVLEDREGSSPTLRARAIFILAQTDADGAEDLLMSVVRRDPDPEVRQQAMFWLGQVPGEQALDLIEEILRGDADAAMRERALFALGQNEHARAGEILKRTAMDGAVSSELRAMAVFWIGQREDEGTLPFLKEIFGKAEDPELKERVLFAIAQTEDGNGAEWLLGVALDAKQPIELRGRAVFWAGQMGELPVDKLEKLYRDVDAPEMREQILFTLAQQDDPKAAEAMMRMARAEKNAQLKARAIFWIGQTDHPDAAAFLEAIITGN